MNGRLPSQARIVIMGGGAIGAALAYHLSELGESDVLLLERSQLGCGTSWHAAGNIPMMGGSELAVQMHRQAGELYAAFEDEQPIGWRRCGRVMLARTADRVTELESLVATANRCGVRAEMITPREVAEKLPLFRTDDLAGALWSPDDGRVNPTDLIHAYVRKARQAGVQVVEGVSVERALTRGNEVVGVSTAEARVQCEVVVNCAGLWARGLGLANAVRVPLYPVEHFYALTEPVEGVHPDMPTFRDPDGLIYGREEVGGLLVGCFDRDAKTFDPQQLPATFSFDLLNEDWEQFGPYMEEGIHRIPALADVGIRTLLNGPESFTPDCLPYLDRAAELEGYYVLAGFSSAGIVHSTGFAQAMAEWLVSGDPGIDVSAFRLSRFSAECNETSWLEERIRHSPSQTMVPGRH